MAAKVWHAPKLNQEAESIEYRSGRDVEAQFTSKVLNPVNCTYPGVNLLTGKLKQTSIFNWAKPQNPHMSRGELGDQTKRREIQRFQIRRLFLECTRKIAEICCFTN